MAQAGATTRRAADALPGPRPVALVTGVGRRIGIGAAIAVRLAADGWDVATTYWAPYDERMPWGHRAQDVTEVAEAVRAQGASTVSIPADLQDVSTPGRVFDDIEAALGPVTALVLSHAESVDSGLLDTTVESLDRHLAVNVRASWLLIREFGLRRRDVSGQGGKGRDGKERDGYRGRLVALTSDHTVGNLPYGASKGALDRIVLAAARELADAGVTANVVNPGPVDTGWMSGELRSALADANPQGRVGHPDDTAALVSFLCSPEGGWINGQLLHSDGGLHA